MKLFTSDQIKAWDATTIRDSGITSFELMQRACRAFVTWFTERYDASHKVYVVCGTGNNGGDGLGIALLLHEWNYPVQVFMVRGTNTTPDFDKSLTLLDGKVTVKEITSSEFDVPTGSIVIDALFGTGLSRELDGKYVQIIKKLNELDVIRVAVDVPSGLRIDAPVSGEIFRADHTVTFQAPKLAFLLPQSSAFIGRWHTVDIGLSKTFVKETKVDHFLVTLKSVKQLIKPRTPFSHKGSYGHALLIAGSTGKMGAAVLAARAALRAGVGLLTVHIPAAGNGIVQSSVSEAMTQQDVSQTFFTACEVGSFYTATGVGPGLGQAPETLQGFKDLLTQRTKPMVLDADALNLLATDAELLNKIPEGSILTPHPGEFMRLVGAWSNDFDKLKKQIALAETTRSVVVLKGAYSSIALPDGSVYFNSTGNPGMATGGSGDVLTGIVTALLAQGYPAAQAAILGVYVHGLAGDLAAREIGETGLIAGDLINYLPYAFKKLE
ncbi:MAG: NAD(P)H-hydrate dehydratase [Bacteroidetes bacterium CHB5]|nr:NAD(P)H-hydrate dehydratase [Bacteroidetes bacterium CHB5]